MKVCINILKIIILFCILMEYIAYNNGPKNYGTAKHRNYNEFMEGWNSIK